MVSGRLLFVFAALVVALIPFGTAPATAAVLHVDPSGTGPYPNIQAAITAAVDGDFVELADGVYQGTGNYNIDFLGKAITLHSQSDNPESCEIRLPLGEFDGGIVLMNGEGLASVLRGVKVTQVVPAVVCDGASPTIENCTFQDCTNWISQTYRGTLSFVSEGIPLTPHINGCRFVNNGANTAVSLEGPGTGEMNDCVFLNNDGYQGAAIMCGDFDISVNRCWFEGNHADWGGAVFTTWCHPTFTDCTFVDNTANYGGAVCGYEDSSPHLLRCTFYGNSAQSAAAVASVSYSRPEIDHCIIAANLGGIPVECLAGGHFNQFTLSCTDVYGNAGGDWVGCIANQATTNGNLSADPLFCDPTNKEFTLDFRSPCAPLNNPGCGQIGAWPPACPAADVESPVSPAAFRVESVQPNPFTGSTRILYSAPAVPNAPANLDIHDVQGRLVRRLTQQGHGIGARVLVWDGRNDQGDPLAAGTYFYRLEWNGQRRGGSITRVR